MNKIINLFTVFCFIALTTSSCEKELTFELSQSSLNFSNHGGTQTITFSINKNWTASVSGGTWCTINPANGSSDTKSITVNVSSNDTYDERSATITINVDGLQKDITVLQSERKVIKLSNKTASLTSDSQILEVELNTNVDYEVVIPENAKSWISNTTTKALRTEKLLLNIANNNGETRSTEIYVINKITNLNDTLTITQFKQFVYWINKMGTLGSILNQKQKDTISIMIVMGEMNKADFEVLKKQMPKLRYLDLKDVKCEGDKIPYEAFGGLNNPNQNLEQIIFPKSITSIESRAFTSCTRLSGSLNLPDGLITIGEFAFSTCFSLSGSLVLPAGLKTIQRFAFAACTGLTGSIYLHDGLTEIGDGAFYNCSGFDGSLKLPDGLTTINASTFENCNGLTGSLKLPLGLTIIGERAFMNCSGFTGSLNLPDGLNEIGQMAFYRCIGFSGSLNLPGGLKSIEIWTFSGCYGFNGNLNLPEKLKTIKDRAFSGCSGFTGSLNLPDELTTIGVEAFADCRNITGLLLGKKLVTIYDYAFYNCDKISGQVIFPITLNSIRQGGFKFCSSVNTFQFPHTTPIPYFADFLPTGATIEVPITAVNSYKLADGWKNYNIVGY